MPKKPPASNGEQTELLRRIWDEMKGLRAEFKSELTATRADFKSELAATRQDLGTRIDETNERAEESPLDLALAKLRSEMGELKAEIEKLKTERTH
jgi:hypothetical protein